MMTNNVYLPTTKPYYSGAILLLNELKQLCHTNCLFIYNNGRKCSTIMLGHK